MGETSCLQWENIGGRKVEETILNVDETTGK
jgi:hypothetical protein